MFKKFYIYFILMFVMSCFTFVSYKRSEKTINITVTNKERITTRSGENISSKFIIYTENEVFENTDTMLYLKFNSADIQNNLKIGENYTITVVGWRIPYLSMFRNIVSING